MDYYDLLVDAWIKSLLYEKHKRKHALWPIIQEKIKGIIIEKEGLGYKP